MSRGLLLVLSAQTNRSDAGFSNENVEDDSDSDEEDPENVTPKMISSDNSVFKLKEPWTVSQLKKAFV